MFVRYVTHLTLCVGFWHFSLLFQQTSLNCALVAVDEKQVTAGSDTELPSESTATAALIQQMIGEYISRDDLVMLLGECFCHPSAMCGYEERFTL